MGWCNDIKNKNYNKLINITKTKYEKMYKEIISMICNICKL